MIPDPSPPISGKMPNFSGDLLMESSLIDCDQYIDQARYVDCDCYVIHNWYVDRNHCVDHAHYVNSNHYVDHDCYVDYACYVDHDHYKVSKLGFMKMKSKMYDKYSLGIKSTAVLPQLWKCIHFLLLTFGWNVMNV